MHRLSPGPREPGLLGPPFNKTVFLILFYSCLDVKRSMFYISDCYIHFSAASEEIKM